MCVLSYPKRRIFSSDKGVLSSISKYFLYVTDSGHSKASNGNKSNVLPAYQPKLLPKISMLSPCQCIEDDVTTI